MFINEGAFKKQIKKAYKSGWLTVGDHLGMLYIGSMSWGMAIDKGAIFNKVKAALIELIGDMPKDGCTYRYSEDEAQQVLDVLGDLDLDTYHTAAGQTYQPTRICVRSSDGEGLYFQGDDLTHCIVSKDAFSLYDIRGIGEDETVPEPPKMKDNYLIWGNNVMALRIFARTTAKWRGENDFLKTIEGVDLCWTFKE